MSIFRLLGVCFQIDRVLFLPEVRFVRACIFRFRWDVSEVGVRVACFAAQMEDVAWHAQGHEFPLDSVDLLTTVCFSRVSSSSSEGASSILVPESVLILLAFLLLRWNFSRLWLGFAFCLPFLRLVPHL